MATPRAPKTSRTLLVEKAPSSPLRRCDFGAASRGIPLDRGRKITWVHREHLHCRRGRRRRHQHHSGEASKDRERYALDEFFVGDDLVNAGRKTAIQAFERKRPVE